MKRILAVLVIVFAFSANAFSQIPSFREKGYKGSVTYSNMYLVRYNGVETLSRIYVQRKPLSWWWSRSLNSGNGLTLTLGTYSLTSIVKGYGEISIAIKLLPRMCLSYEF